MNAREYAEQLEAHIDAGGSYTAANVRDLIKMIKSQDRLMEKLAAVVYAKLKANILKELRLQELRRLNAREVERGLTQ